MKCSNAAVGAAAGHEPVVQRLLLPACSFRLQELLLCMIGARNLGEMYRRLFSQVTFRFPGSARRLLHGGQDREGPPAFVFDIDGVLIKGERILEPAKKALGLLYEDKGTQILSALGSGSVERPEIRC